VSESYSIVKRDTKDELLKSAQTLRYLAQKEIAKLKAEGKSLLASSLEKTDKLVIDLKNLLQNLNPTTDIGKAFLITIEAGLKKAETAIEDEIKKFSGSFYADDLKDELLKQAQNLNNMANDWIAKLKQQGKGDLTVNLEKVLKLVFDYETEIKNLDANTEIGKDLLVSVQDNLKKVETTLKDELKKLDSNEDILKDMAFVTEVRAELNKTKPTTGLGKVLVEELELFLDFAKIYIEAEDLKKNKSNVNKRDTEEDLLKNAQSLRALAQKEISKLKAEGKTLLAAGLDKTDKLLIDLETQLRNLNPVTEVDRALLIKIAEISLEVETKKLSGIFFFFFPKDELLKRAENLKNVVTNGIEILKKQGKDLFTGTLERVQENILDLETQIKKLDLNSEVGKNLLKTVKGLLDEAEFAFELQGKVLSESLDGIVLKYNLFKQIEDFKKSVTKYIAELKAEGKGALTGGLEAIEKSVLDLETQLNNSNPTTEVGKSSLISIEALLKKAETTLTDELMKLSIYVNSVSVHTVIIEFIVDLLIKFKTEVEILQKEGKTALVADLHKSIKFSAEVEVKLRNVHPITDSSKQLLEFLKIFNKFGNDALEDYLKKANQSL